MPRAAKRLTARQVETLTRKGRYADGGSLYLQVTAAGTRSWLFRYKRDGKARAMGLGPADVVTLAQARDLAIEQRRVLLNGADPIAARNSQRNAARLEAAKAITFRTAAEQYIAAQKAGWSNAKHAGQWQSTLETYAYPVIGHLAVADVDTGLVLRVVEPIWTTKPETASRVRSRLENVLDWARVRGYRAGDNPARWRGHLEKLLPARSKVRTVRHHPAMPYGEIGAFMADLRGREAIAARALELLILTATRSGEVLNAHWSEIDLNAATWTIPAERMKAGREHRVPLSGPAVALLQRMGEDHGTDGFVFPGQRPGRPLSDMALAMLLRRMGTSPDHATVHGFRSTFRDWTAESTAYPRDVAEMALAHAVSDKVEAAYRRGDLFDKRARLMADWATYCGQVERAGEVIALRGRDR